MSLSPKTLKLAARDAMHTCVPPAFLVTLLFLTLTDVLSEIVYAFTPVGTTADPLQAVPLFLSILLLMFRIVMSFGYSSWTLQTARGEEVGLGGLLDGFGMVGRVLLLKLHTIAGMLGRMLLLTTAYVLLSTSVTVLLPFSVSTVLFLLLTAAYALGLQAVEIQFSLAPFLLCDYPDEGSSRAVLRALHMTHGNLWALIKLHLSFWPWYLLQFAISACAAALILSPMLPEISQIEIMGDIPQIITSVEYAVSSALSSPVTVLVSIPLLTFFLPYRSISVANFYRSLNGELSQPEEPAFF